MGQSCSIGSIGLTKSFSMKKVPLFLCQQFFSCCFIHFIPQVTWEKIFSKKYRRFSICCWSSFRRIHSYGYTSDSTVNDTDAYVVRMNTSGDTLWTKRMNSPSSRKDLFYKVINTADGGFGFCWLYYKLWFWFRRCMVVKTDANGNVQWINTWG